jgi:hypothetical protein
MTAFSSDRRVKLKARVLSDDQSGAALVEFALILPLLLLLVFGIIEFSLLLYNKAVITNASREGARFGIVYSPSRPDPLDQSTFDDRMAQQTADIIDRAESYCGNYLITFGDGEVTPQLIQGPCQDSGENLEVQVTYPYDFLIFPDILAGLFGGDDTGRIQLSARTIMRCE